MSRIGKQLISIPEKVEVNINGDLIMIKGSKGELTRRLPRQIKVQISEGKIALSIDKNSGGSDKNLAALWGLSRALISNMVKGVSVGWQKKLEIEGIGYRAALDGEKLVLTLGYSHPITIAAPPGIKFEVIKNMIIVSGVDKELVGQVAAKIRDQRKPEPYKGKGIRYEGEKIKIKAGKKAVSSGI